MTERMALRRLVAADAARLFDLDSDPKVRRYVHAGPPDLARIREEVLPRMLGFDDDAKGAGFWAAEERTTGAFLGWFHLRLEDRGAEMDLGFRLRREVWGRGLATEGSAHLVARAFARPELQRIVAVTLVRNRASQRVLEKVGFEQAEEFMYEPPPGAQVEDDDRRRPALRYVLGRVGTSSPVRREP
jgi:RimJ/RimL family protein N-acetyltransferase